MDKWPTTKAPKVLAALIKIGWVQVRQNGSHRTLKRDGWANYVFAFHDDVEIGSGMLKKIAKATGLTREDL